MKELKPVTETLWFDKVSTMDVIPRILIRSFLFYLVITLLVAVTV